jgi:hypothetical protein
LVVPLELIFALVFDGAVLPGAAVLPGVSAPLWVPELFGAPVTRVSVLAAVPPCGFTA